MVVDVCAVFLSGLRIVVAAQVSDAYVALVLAGFGLVLLCVVWHRCRGGSVA